MFHTYKYVSYTYQYVPLHRIRIWHVFWLCGTYAYVVAYFCTYWYIAVRIGTYWYNSYLVCISCLCVHIWHIYMVLYVVVRILNIQIHTTMCQTLNTYQYVPHVYVPLRTTTCQHPNTYHYVLSSTYQYVPKYVPIVK